MPSARKKAASSATKEVSVLDRVKAIAAESPEMSLSVVAVKALLDGMRVNKASTQAELLKDVDIACTTLKRSDNANKIAMIAGADLFLTMIKNNTSPTTVFEDWKREIDKNATYMVEQFASHREKAAEKGLRFIKDDDVILVHSYSRVVMKLLHRASQTNKRFKVFVTESRPSGSGEKVVKELRQANIPAELISDAAVGYVIEQVDYVIVGAEGVTQNGGVINQMGTYQLAVVAKAANKPFYVVAESYKFVKIFPLNQYDLPVPAPSYFSETSAESPITPTVPSIDYTPPQYISLLFTNEGVLTPSRVSEELSDDCKKVALFSPEFQIAKFGKDFPPLVLLTGTIPIRLQNIEIHSIPHTRQPFVPEDYPPWFRSAAKVYAHPDDYNATDTPIQPTVFLYRDGERARLFYRTSLRTSDGKFTTATFLLDTAGCPAIYLSPTLQTLLRGRIEEDDLGTRWITTKVGETDQRLLVRFDVPSEHRPANVMGLPMFFLLGLRFPQIAINRLDYDADGVSTNCAETNIAFL